MKILLTKKDSIPHLQADIIELAKILSHLRSSTMYWETHYGRDNRNKKIYWENKADTWLQNNLQHEE